MARWEERLRLRPAKNTICAVKSMAATYSQCVWGEGRRIKSWLPWKLTLGDPGSMWLSVPPALTKEAELSRGSGSRDCPHCGVVLDGRGGRGRGENRIFRGCC